MKTLRQHVLSLIRRSRTVDAGLACYGFAEGVSRLQYFWLSIAVLWCVLQSHATDYLYFTDRVFQQSTWSYPLRRIATDGTGLQTVISDGASGGIAFDVADDSLYTGGGTWLYRTRLDGTDRVNLVPAVNPVQDVELDLVHGKIYWSEGAHGRNAMRCANLDGSAARTIIDVGYDGGFPGLAVDPYGQKLFFVRATGASDTIQVMNLDGTGQSLAYFLGSPGGLAGDLEIDLDSGTLYFNYGLEPSGPYIYGAPANGSSTVELVLASAGSINGMHYDPIDNRLYFVNHSPSDNSYRIQSARTDGTDLRTVVPSPGMFYWMEVAHISMTQNHAPVAGAQMVATTVDAPVDVLLGATDPDNDPLTVMIDDAPLHGNLTGVPPHVTYTPDPGYIGADSFTFHANDGTLDSSVATVSITISPGGALIGTYTINYRENAAGCYVDQSNPDMSQANPYYCNSIPPGPIFIPAIPGAYELMIVAGQGFYAWSGDATGGTPYLSGLFGTGPGTVVNIDHVFGEIALYFWDWNAYDNDPNVTTTIAVYRSSMEPPTIACPSDITVSSAPGQCSQIVDFEVIASGDSVVVVCDPPSGSPFPEGMTTVTCIATDTAGQSASCSFTVTVNDAEPPVITCPADIVLPCSAELLLPAAFEATATDNCDASPSVTYSISPGSGFPVGVTSVTVTAIDLSGNAASGEFTVTRPALGFDGFLQPIGGADASGGSLSDPVRTFKLNSTIPVKFTASCDGTPVVTGIHTIQAVKWSSQTEPDVPIDATPADAATTGNQFRLASDNQWHFNLDTKATGMTAGKWQLVATLSDGSEHVVWIQIK